MSLNKLPPLKDLVVEKDCSLKDTLKIIEKGGQRIAFVVNNQRLINVITDGDIRRALLKKFTLNTNISKIIAKKRFKYLNVNASLESIEKEMGTNLTHLPLVNNQNKLVDYAINFKLNKIPVSEPQFLGNETLYLNDCINSGWISSGGKYVKLFEKSFSKFVKSKYTLSVTSGTTALHLALASLGIKKDDEVILPNLTFISPVNAAIYLGAKPVLVDIDENNLCIDPKKIEKAITKKTRAIVLVYLYGHGCDVDKIKKITKKYNLILVEDCAEGMGTYFKNRHVGNFGDTSTFSFFGNKTITTGEGGMVCFKKKKHYEIAKKLRDHGMNPKKRYWHDHIGYNYRMTNIQAAIGLAQMERLEFFIKQKKIMAKKYRFYLNKNKQIFFSKNFSKTESSYWLYYIKLKKKISHARDAIINILLKKGIEVRNCFYPIHLMNPYKKYHSKKNNLEKSIKLSQSIIALPSSVNLGDKEIKNICANLNSVLRKFDL
tara:strand:- start:2022 stop:3488 length:1467 start_codon:yes stop_codon:yes gene_type:complete